MLPTYLWSSYRRYKEDTHSIASWLAQTASKCGFHVDQHTPKVEVHKRMRLKGQVRKRTKQNNDMKKGALSPAKTQYIIAIKDYLTLARHIAAFEPPVAVPDSICTILERNIGLRRDVGGHVSVVGPQNNPENKASEARHLHFVEILEQVQKILKPRMPLRTSMPKSEVDNDAQKDPQTSLSNMFSILEVQEPRNDPTDAPLDRMPKQLSSVDEQPIYLAETTSSEDPDEAFVALVCLLNDFSRIRELVISTWIGYKNNAWDLVTASVTSNTAMEIAKHLEKEVEDIFQKYGGPEKLFNIYFVSGCPRNDPEGFEKDLLREKFDVEDMITESLESYEFAYACCMPAFSILNRLRTMYDRGSKWNVFRPGHWGIYDPTVDRASLNAAQKFAEDKILLCEAFTSFKVISMNEERQAGDDELVRGIIKMFETKEIPVSLGLSAQLYLDIHHNLRDKVQCAFQDLLNMSRYVYNTIETNLEFHRYLRTETWSESNDQGFHDLQSYILHDVLGDPIRRKVEMNSPTVVQYLEKHYLLKNYPVRCGLCAYNVKLQFNDMAVAFVNCWGSVILTSHLYNAMDQEKLLDTCWPDMRAVLGIQNHRHLFAGSLPKCPDQYAKRVCLIIGLSVSNFARNRRQNNNRLAVSTPRGLEYPSEVHRMFARKHSDIAEQSDISVQDMQKILEKGRWLSVEQDDDSVIMERRSRTKATQKPHIHSSKIKQASVTGLLQGLLQVLYAEQPEFSFDYLLLHRMCWRLLDTIRDVTEPLMARMFGADYLHRESDLPFLVVYILLAMASEEHTAQVAALLPRDAGFADPSLALLQLAADEANAMTVMHEGMACAPSEVALTRLKEVYGFSCAFKDGGLSDDDVE